VSIRHRLSRPFFLAWAFYLVVGNLFLIPAVGARIISPHQERFSISWGLSWTVIPGLVHVHRLKIRQHTKDIVWSLEIKRATTGINLLALPFRTFHTVFSRASGVAVKIEKAPTRMPSSGKTKPGWRILLWNTSIGGIHSMEFRGINIEGDDIRISGNLDTTARGPFGISGASLCIKGGRITTNGVPLADALDIDLSTRIRRHRKEDREQNSMLPYISGHVGASGDLEDLRFLDTLIRGLPWLRVRGGAGHMECSLGITDGLLDSGSDLKIRTSAFTFGYLDYEAGGRGLVTLKSMDTTGDGARLDFRLNDFHLGFEDSGTPHIEGNNLSLSVVGTLQDMLLGRKNARVTLDIPPSRIPDLRVYNRYIPPSTTFKILSGNGTIESHFEINNGAGFGKGSIKVRAQDISCDLQGKKIRADLEAHFPAEVKDMKNKVFSIDGSRIKITNAGVDLPGEGEKSTDLDALWWCNLDITKASIRLVKPVAIELSTKLLALDAAPVLALMSKTRKSADRLEKLLDIHELSGGADLIAGGGRTIIRDFHAEGGRAEILGTLCLKKKGRSGAIFIRYGILNLSVELLDEDDHKHIINSRKWFDAYMADFDCRRQEPSAVVPHAAGICAGGGGP